MYGQIFGLHSTRSRIGLALASVAITICGTCFNASADETLPSSLPDFPSVIRTHSHQLAKIESDKDALNLFVSAIGPALQLGDAARALRMNPASVKLMNELLVPDLTAAAHRLIGNLSAWRLASTVREAVKDRQLATVHEQLFGPPEARAWLDQQRNMPWNDPLTQLSILITSPEWARESQGDSIPTLLVSVLEQATRMEVAAMQATYQEWDRIRNWKDRVRGLRGQARLCGTWQWIIHNHQRNHQEQKFSLVFPPGGHTESLPPGLVESFILGENVYLRWETDRLVQEDSLQFSKEGHRLEGTFVNSQGGWGSISGKRTVSCTP
ncbi:MAG TPA: hypothetical protein VJU02_03720 [Nitrospiraceae bacterium]|nr:hypothetical protein [Nitrospiraceae bacterium]